MDSTVGVSIEKTGVSKPGKVASIMVSATAAAICVYIISDHNDLGKAWAMHFVAVSGAEANFFLL